MTEKKQVKKDGGWDGPFVEWLENQDLTDKQIQLICADVANFALWFEQYHHEIFEPQKIRLIDIFVWFDRHVIDKQKFSFKRRQYSIRIFVRWINNSGRLDIDQFIWDGWNHD